MHLDCQKSLSQIVQEIDSELLQTVQWVGYRHEKYETRQNELYHLDLKALKKDIFKATADLTLEEIGQLLAPYSFAACMGNRRKTMEFILKVGGHVRDKKMENIIHEAARCCNAGVIKWMFAEGADVAAINDEGQTPLHLMSDWANVHEEDEYIYKSVIKCVQTLIRYMVLQDCKDSAYISHKPCYISDVDYAHHISRITFFRHQCQIELEYMKKLEISRGVTLYNILTGGSSHVWRKNVRGKEYSHIYGDMLDIKFKEGLERFNALRVGVIVISHFAGLVPDLSFVLSDYLNNSDIKNLRRAAIQTMDEPRKEN